MFKKVGLGVLVVGLMICFITFQDGIAAMRPWVNLYDENVNISDVSTWDMLEIDVVEVWGSYATKETTRNGVKESEVSYYIIPAFEGDEYRFIGIEVPEKEYDLFDQIMEETYDYHNGYSFETNAYTYKTGRLHKMNKEMLDLYYDFFKQYEWYDTDEEIKKNALPYYVDSITDPNMSTKILAFGAIMSLAGAAILVFAFMRGNQKQQKAMAQDYVTINGVTYPKQRLSHVNACILGQEKIFAAQELSEITGLSMEEAGKIVEDWKKYYY